jgi:hypothetical protein
MISCHKVNRAAERASQDLHDSVSVQLNNLRRLDIIFLLDSLLCSSNEWKKRKTSISNRGWGGGVGEGSGGRGGGGGEGFQSLVPLLLNGNREAFLICEESSGEK